MLPNGINDVDNILLQRRTEAVQDANKRKEKLFAENPIIAEYYGELVSLRVERLSAMRLKSDCGNIDNQISDTKNKIEIWLKENGYPQDHLEPQYKCKICNDTGYVNAKRCVCAEKMVFELMYRNASLFGADQQNFENFDLSVFEGEDEISKKQYADIKKIHAFCVKYADKFAIGSPNLIFTGNTGTGKTYLSNCIAGRVLQNGHSVLAISAYELVEELRNASFNGSGELKKFQNVQLLVIDELGMEQMLNNITVELLFMVINERCRRGLPIIINTNLTPQQMTQRYTERITSRLFDKDKSVVLKFEGHDIRLKNR